MQINVRKRTTIRDGAFLSLFNTWHHLFRRWKLACVFGVRTAHQTLDVRECQQFASCRARARAAGVKHARRKPNEMFANHNV